jgi:hypothetical protein
MIILAPKIEVLRSGPRKENCDFFQNGPNDLDLISVFYVDRILRKISLCPLAAHMLKIVKHHKSLNIR